MFQYYPSTQISESLDGLFVQQEAKPIKPISSMFPAIVFFRARRISATRSTHEQQQARFCFCVQVGTPLCLITWVFSLSVNRWWSSKFIVDNCKLSICYDGCGITGQLMGSVQS